MNLNQRPELPCPPYINDFGVLTMKVIKTLTIFCAAIILNSFFINSVFGQNTDKTQTFEKKAGLIQEKVGDNSTDKQILAQQQQSDEKYRIGFQDTLEIQVFRHPELSQVVSVSPDGTILMPRIDKPIIAVCKTERELRETIGTLYKNYLRNPFVNVRAVEQRSQPFAVIGAVEKPGNFYLNRKIRLLELLAFAGGPDVEKAGAKIQVARVGNSAGCAEVDGVDDKVVFLSYRVKDVMSGDANPWMEPGDIVSVLVAEEAYVTGNVIEPATVSLREPMTLTQAIAKAGGIAPEAKTSKITIQRQGADGIAKTETVYDLKDIVAKKVDDPILQANDIVNVPKDGVKSLRNQFLKAVTGGIGNIFYKIP